MDQNHVGLRRSDAAAAALTADVDVRQYLAAGDDVDLLGHSLQVVQDQPDAVRGVDNGSLRGVELRRRTLNLLSKKIKASYEKYEELCCAPNVLLGVCVVQATG